MPGGLSSSGKIVFACGRAAVIFEITGMPVCTRSAANTVERDLPEHFSQDSCLTRIAIE
jgi:hypothetical protein